MAYNASQQLTNSLGRFTAERSNARRFHKAILGDVDPQCCLGDWLLRVARHDTAGIEKVYGKQLPDGVRSGADSDLGYVQKTAMSTGSSGQTGGYLVPQELLNDIMGDVGEDAIIRPRATVCPMQSATLLLPLPDASTAQAATTSSFFGGIDLNFTQEAATRGETEPQFRLVELHAWELSGYLYLSNPLAQDAIALDTWLRQLVARSIAWYEDYFFFRGSGVGQPMGLVNAPGTVTAASRSAPNVVATSDVGLMANSFLPFSWDEGIWAMSVGVWKQLTTFTNGAWQANQPIPEGRGTPNFVLNGQAGFTTEKLPALGTAGDIILFDPRLYVIGDRRATEIAVSMHEPTAFKANQQAWRCVHRVDGQPWFSKTITLADAATVVSPYVILHA